MRSCGVYLHTGEVLDFDKPVAAAAPEACRESGRVRWGSGVAPEDTGLDTDRGGFLVALRCDRSLNELPKPCAIAPSLGADLLPTLEGMGVADGVARAAARLASARAAATAPLDDTASYAISLATDPETDPAALEQAADAEEARVALCGLASGLDEDGWDFLARMQQWLPIPGEEGDTDPLADTKAWTRYLRRHPAAVATLRVIPTEAVRFVAEKELLHSWVARFSLLFSSTSSSVLWQAASVWTLAQGEPVQAIRRQLSTEESAEGASRDGQQGGRPPSPDVESPSDEEDWHSSDPAVSERAEIASLRATLTPLVQDQLGGPPPWSLVRMAYQESGGSVDRAAAILWEAILAGGD